MMRRRVVRAGKTGLDMLELDQTVLPLSRPAEARIRGKAAGLNHGDRFVLQGEHERLLNRDFGLA